MKAVLISHGSGMPSRSDVEIEPKLIEGMYLKVKGSAQFNLTPHAYLYAPEHADKAFALLVEQYREEQAMHSKHAKEWNSLSAWRIKV